MSFKPRNQERSRFAATDASWATGNGHVGFVVSLTSTTVTLLGGNQGNTREDIPRLEKNAAGAKQSEFVAFLMPVIV